MQTLIEFFSIESTPAPCWLTEYRTGVEIDLGAFLSSRAVFYPGSDYDLHAIQSFGLSGASCCFIQADFGILKEELRDRVTKQGLRFPMVLGPDEVAEWYFDQNEVGSFSAARRGELAGYTIHALIDLNILNVLPKNSISHLSEVELQAINQQDAHVTPYALFGIFEKNGNHPKMESWPPRLAVLFLGAEAIGAYDALFCQSGHSHPYAVLIPNGMHPNLRPDGMLGHLIERTTIRPDWLLMDTNLPPMMGFEWVESVEIEDGRGIFQWKEFEGERQ